MVAETSFWFCAVIVVFIVLLLSSVFMSQLPSISGND
jgi:hypothetical protein